MARWHYPRSRRIVMQIVMCVIFAGSLGLAELVTHQRRIEGSTPLEGIRYRDDVGVRLPKGWALQLERTRSILFIAKEPGTQDRTGRTILVRRLKVEPSLSAMDCLNKSGMLLATRNYVPDGQTDAGPESITLANSPGSMLPVERPDGIMLFGPTAFAPEWLACSVRHSGVAIILQLMCPDEEHPDEDKQTLRDVAAGIEVKD